MSKKIALINDSHVGARGDNQFLSNNFNKFLENIFFPTIDNLNIDTIINLGDLVDRRKYININTAKILRETWFEPIINRKIDYHHILGNHDCYYKSTNDVNSVNELTRGYGFNIYYQAEEVIIKDNKLLFVPWINQENAEHSYKLIKESNAQICLGHLQLSGFEMYKGSVVSHGDDRNIFDKFYMTLSGHFHHRSTDGTIYYLGSPAEFTWADYNDTKGFHIFDLETRELTFVENPYKMFKKAFYDDVENFHDEILSEDFSKYEGTYCKIIVKNKTNPYTFDLFCDMIEKSGVIDLQIIEDNKIIIDDEDQSISSTESTETIFKKYIQSITNTTIDKEKLERVILELHQQATINN